MSTTSVFLYILYSLAAASAPCYRARERIDNGALVEFRHHCPNATVRVVDCHRERALCSSLQHRSLSCPHLIAPTANHRLVVLPHVTDDRLHEFFDALVDAWWGASTLRDGPDFVLVGTPKSGSTTFMHMLAEHPQVRRARKKEINGWELPDADTYRRQFPLETPTTSPVRLQRDRWPWVSGDGSIQLCMKSRATVDPDRMRADYPRARFIALLRDDPVERALSHYAMCVGMGAYTRAELPVRAQRALLQGPRIVNDSHFCDNWLVPSYYQEVVLDRWRPDAVVWTSQLGDCSVINFVFTRILGVRPMACERIRALAAPAAAINRAGGSAVDNQVVRSVASPSSDADYLDWPEAHQARQMLLESGFGEN